MEYNVCGNCKQFYPHFTLGEKELVCVYCGHCTHPRLKHRKPDAKACEYFEPGKRLENHDFASKPYLTKALLRSILERDLLPEIRDSLLEYERYE